MNSSVAIRTDQKGNVGVADAERPESPAVDRFRDRKRLLRERMGFEVTNEVALDVILDVFDLHVEREGLAEFPTEAGR